MDYFSNSLLSVVQKESGVNEEHKVMFIKCTSRGLLSLWWLSNIYLDILHPKQKLLLELFCLSLFKVVFYLNIT
ncbi:hypothetical protein MtrunA17_Chr2g0312881 [Medicago truncatula]|uniref:Uncharacterized protein n=1 Tax=Medicago truncatula TaxID=3880 RepID=A0A396JDH0_MEDTR|nr:hypothetical protein MtrunA17_Chr2g0312881 [Medicago truncatula]